MTTIPSTELALMKNFLCEGISWFVVREHTDATCWSIDGPVNGSDWEISLNYDVKTRNNIVWLKPNEITTDIIMTEIFLDKNDQRSSFPRKVFFSISMSKINGSINKYSVKLVKTRGCGRVSTTDLGFLEKELIDNIVYALTNPLPEE